jgi:Uncharacterized conserved protein
MAAVKYIEQPTEELRPIYESAKNHFGHVPNLVKALGSNFQMCRTITGFLIQSLNDGLVDWKFKELVIIKTLRAMKSHYSFGAHQKLALNLGASENQLSDLSNSLWTTSSSFSDKEKLVFELIEQIAIDANAVPKELWEKLRQHWTDGQLVELNGVISTFIMIGRVGDALGVVDNSLFSKSVTSN